MSFWSFRIGGRVYFGLLKTNQEQEHDAFGFIFSELVVGPDEKYQETSSFDF